MSSRLQVSFSCHNIWKFISQIYEINVVKRPTCLAKTLIQESSPVYAKQNARQLPNFHKLHTNPTKLISQDLQRFSCRNLIINSQKFNHSTFCESSKICKLNISGKSRNLRKSQNNWMEWFVENADLVCLLPSKHFVLSSVL